MRTGTSLQRMLQGARRREEVFGVRKRTTRKRSRKTSRRSRKGSSRKRSKKDEDEHDDDDSDDKARRFIIRGCSRSLSSNGRTAWEGEVLGGCPAPLSNSRGGTRIASSPRPPAPPVFVTTGGVSDRPVFVTMPVARERRRQQHIVEDGGGRRHRAAGQGGDALAARPRGWVGPRADGGGQQFSVAQRSSSPLDPGLGKGAWGKGLGTAGGLGEQLDGERHQEVACRRLLPAWSESDPAPPPRADDGAGRLDGRTHQRRTGRRHRSASSPAETVTVTQSLSHRVTRPHRTHGHAVTTTRPLVFLVLLGSS